MKMIEAKYPMMPMGVKAFAICCQKKPAQSCAICRRPGSAGFFSLGFSSVRLVDAHQLAEGPHRDIRQCIRIL